MSDPVICEHWSSNKQKRCQITFNSSMPHLGVPDIFCFLYLIESANLISTSKDICRENNDKKDVQSGDS